MGASKQETKRVDVVVQGGGIGGLTLARGLQQKGFEALVVEREAGPTRMGAGIWMAPNALKVFAELGIIEPILRASCPVQSLELLDHTGEVLSGLDLATLKNEFGYDTAALHRADLQKVLFDSLSADTVSFGAEVSSWAEFSEGLEITLSDGRRIRAALLIGADGLGSQIRGKLFPDSRMRYSGSSSYRGISHSPVFPSNCLYQSQEIWAPGCRFGFSPVSADQIYWFLTFEAPAGEKGSARENFGQATALVGKYFSRHSELVRAMEPANIIRTDISDLEPLACWSIGRIGLLGDAAHATTPNLGQGGAQAVEDARVLADEIARLGPCPEVLTTFLKRRQAKVNWIVSTSWRYGRLCHQKGKLIRRRRNLMFKLTPDSVTLNQFRKIYRFWD